MRSAIVLLQILGGYGHSCNATRFGDPGDKWVGGRALALGRRVNSTDIGVAHRTFKLRSKLLICISRTGRCAIAPVIDRGPYGAMYHGKWRLKRRQRDKGKWRSCLDLTPALSNLLGHNGYEQVIYMELR